MNYLVKTKGKEVPFNQKREALAYAKKTTGDCYVLDMNQKVGYGYKLIWYRLDSLNKGLI